MKAIILAAGRGNRLRPITDSVPKALIPIHGRPLLEHVLESLPGEISEVIIVADYLKEQIEDFASKNSTLERPIRVTSQTAGTNGTMAALLSAKEYLSDERFLVVNGDDIHQKKYLEEMLQHERAFGVQLMDMPGYHAIREKGGFISHFEPNTEGKLTPVATGAYVLDTHIFDIDPVVLRDGEIGLPQTILVYKELFPVRYVITEGWIPINSHEDLAKI